MLIAGIGYPMENSKGPSPSRVPEVDPFTGNSDHPWGVVIVEVRGPKT